MLDVTPSSDHVEKKTDFGYETIDEDNKVEHVREVFNGVAAKYDLLNDIFSLGMHRLWKRVVVSEATVSSGMKVLDIASGTCDLAIKFARQAGDGNVVASDINHEMLAIGKTRMEREGYHCHAVEADAENLPFPENTFDVITVSFGIRNMTHKDRALKEMFRVLKPEGKLIVLEFSKCRPWVRPFFDFYSFRFMPWVAGLVAGEAYSYRYLAESIRMHPDQEAFAGLMTGAGFAKVHWKNLTFGICAMHVGVKGSPIQ